MGEATNKFQTALCVLAATFPDRLLSEFWNLGPIWIDEPLKSTIDLFLGITSDGQIKLPPTEMTSGIMVFGQRFEEIGGVEAAERFYP